jgi:plastocyanin
MRYITVVSIWSIIILSITISYFLTIVDVANAADTETDIIPTTYISYVDDNLGFYKVRNLDIPPRTFEYNDHTLNIYQGDTIIWQNDAERTTFTILSDQNLWDSNVGYLRVESKMNYKFDIPGKYSFYMKEHKSIRQTIIVNAVNENPTKTTIPTIIPTAVNTPSHIPTVTITSSPMVTIDSINSNMSGTKIVSIIVALLSLFIIYRVGKNK